jgi:hypothetical protein
MILNECQVLILFLTIENIMIVNLKNKPYEQLIVIGFNRVWFPFVYKIQGIILTDLLSNNEIASFICISIGVTS